MKLAMKTNRSLVERHGRERVFIPPSFPPLRCSVPLLRTMAPTPRECAVESFPVLQSAVQRPRLCTPQLILLGKQYTGVGCSLAAWLNQRLQLSKSRLSSSRALCSGLIGAATAGRGLVRPDADWAAMLCPEQSILWYRGAPCPSPLCNIHPAAPPHKRRSLPSPTWQLHGWHTGAQKSTIKCRRLAVCVVIPPKNQTFSRASPSVISGLS